MSIYLNKGKVGNSYLSEYDVSELQKIPLFIHIPGVTDNNKGKAIDTVGGQVDIKPTILNLLGINSDKDLEFGRDLFNKNHDNKIVFRNGNVMSKDLILTEKKCYVRPEYAKSYLTDSEINRQDKLEKEFNYLDKYKRYLNSRFIDVLKESNVDSSILSEYEELISKYLDLLKDNKSSLVSLGLNSNSNSTTTNNIDLSAYLDIFNQLNYGYNKYINSLSDEELKLLESKKLKNYSDLESYLNNSSENNFNDLFDFINFIKLNPERFNSGYKVNKSLCSDLKSFGSKELDISDKLIYGDLLRFESSIEPELKDLENEDLQENLMREMSK